MLTTNFRYDLNEGRAENSNIDGIVAPVRFGNFFMSDLVGSAENILNNPARSMSRFQLPTPYVLRKSSEKGHRKMANTIILFKFNQNQVRTTAIDNTPWFVATDVARALEYRDSEHATRYLDDDEKGTLNQGTPGKELSIINESGLYSLILRSRKPEAKAFKKFVTSEVLPQIRQTGAYMSDKPVGVTAHARSLPFNDKIKNFLTTYFCYDYTGSLKTAITAFTPRQSVFFMPFLAWTRAENIQYQPKLLIAAFSESTTSQISIDNLKNIAYLAVKRLNPLGNTHYCPRQIGIFLLSFYGRECANILNKHRLLLSAGSNSRRLVLLGRFEPKDNIMKNSISIYNFKQNQIRTTAIDGQPWFCLIDCQAALGLAKTTKTQIRLPEAGVRKQHIRYASGSKLADFINEPNLYRLIFRSNKPQAQAFADWVYSEVLPQIRQTGAYMSDKPVEVTVHARSLPSNDEIKNFLTTYFCYDYTGGLKTNGGNRPCKSGDFFMPIFWGMRTVNISNSGQRPLAFSESPTCSISGGLSKKPMEATLQELISYTFKNSQIRTTVIDNTPWFVATDVARALEYRDSEHATRYLDDDEKGTLNQSTLGGNQAMLIINESGLYSLILRSRKPEAKAFKKFVTSEVLPQIRQTGAYMSDKPVEVTAHARSLPSGKKEIVLSEKAKAEIGGIVKNCLSAVKTPDAGENAKKITLALAMANFYTRHDDLQREADNLRHQLELCEKAARQAKQEAEKLEEALQ